MNTFTPSLRPDEYTQAVLAFTDRFPLTLETVFRPTGETQVLEMTGGKTLIVYAVKKVVTLSYGEVIDTTWRHTGPGGGSVEFFTREECRSHLAKSLKKARKSASRRYVKIRVAHYETVRRVDINPRGAI